MIFLFIKLVTVGLIMFDIFLHLPHTYLFPTFIKNIEWEESPDYLFQMSCNYSLICLETCVIAILWYLFCFIFQSLLMAIGTAFLYNVDEFKIYSTYCANHSKAQKALHQSELFNQPLSLMILSWRNSSRNFQTFTDCSGVYSGRRGWGFRKGAKPDFC